MDSDRSSNFHHQRTPRFNRLLGIDSPPKNTSTGEHSDSDEDLSEGDVLYGNENDSPPRITTTSDHSVSDHDLDELNSLDIGEGSSATIASGGEEFPVKIASTCKDSVSENELSKQDINNIRDSLLKIISTGDESPGKITSTGQTSVANNDLNEDDVSYAGDSAEPNQAISGKTKYNPAGEKGVPAALLVQNRSILNRRITVLSPQITSPSSSSSNLPPMTSSSLSNFPMTSSSSSNLPMTSSPFPPKPIRPSASSSSLISDKALEVPQAERVAKSMPAMKCRYPIGKKSKPIDIKNPAQRDLTDSGEEMMKPHQILAERYAMSDRKVTSSMFKGFGRTLKGKDQFDVRNAAWERTNFKKPDDEQLGSCSQLTKHRKEKGDSDNDDEER